MELKEIKEILKAPRNKELVSRLSLHEGRLKLHSETTISYSSTSAITEFLNNYVKQLIPGDKFFVFKSLLRFPILTVPTVNEVNEKLSRVFDGVNPVRDYIFKSPESETDWLEYKDGEFWKAKGFKAFKQAINSIVVVDLPSEQKTKLPEPYAFILDIAAVIDLGLSEDEKTIESVCFRPNNNPEKLAFYDSEYYRVFRTKPKELEIQETLVEERHELGVCPANWFWNDEFSVLTPFFGKLDWLLFFMISKQQLDLHGAYPIYSGYEVDCDYSFEADKNNYECDGGFLRNSNAGPYLLSPAGDGLRQCPACRSKRISGAGSFVEVPAPQDSTDPDLRNPVSMLTVDRNSLDYNVDEETRLINNIFTGVTGVQGEAINDQAVNEKQVFAGLESETNVLRTIAKGFERIEKWTDDIICLLRYGKEDYQGCSISYGTQFHLVDAPQLLEAYNKLKLSGVDSIILDVLQDQYFQTKFRNNQDQQRRQEILLHLDPFRHLTKAETGILFDKGLIKDVEYLYKVNFSALIRRFEREQMDIVTFGENIHLDKKVDKINEIIKGYIEIPEIIIKEENQNYGTTKKDN